MTDKWKAIQRWAGVHPDGVPGNKTADAIIAKAGIGAAIAPAPGNAGLVKGTGKNIKRIFIHCTATREGQDVGAATIRGWHKAQGWSDIGYHFVIRLDGTIERGRDESIPGSHAQGYNTGSIALVYVGGLDSQGKAKDTRNTAQLEAMTRLVRALTAAYPNAEVLGHRDISPDLDGDGVVEKHEWLKECPCFDVRAWWAPLA